LAPAGLDGTASDSAEAVVTLSGAVARRAVGCAAAVGVTGSDAAAAGRTSG
jgi:hypothetical protein